MHDANFNVTALDDTEGDILERYYYEAYGRPVYLGKRKRATDHMFTRDKKHQNFQAGAFVSALRAFDRVTATPPVARATC
jgi:hypothetical protein